MRYFLELSYKGTGYHGWQEQSNSPDTIQEICNASVSKVLNQKINLAGAGRTDTGVHAEQFFAHFDYVNEKLVEEKFKWLYKFNSVSPYSIAFNNILAVKPTAHARFNAILRTYRYDISLRRNPFLYERAMFLPYNVDLKKMNAAATLLHEYKDFSSFKKNPRQQEDGIRNAKTDICTITKAHWEGKGDRLEFTISANRFLRNMVRAIVGTMLNVGNGKWTIEDFCRIIESRDRGKAGASVPPYGLYLTSVKYPPELFIL